VQWLRQAQNWAKFSSVASLGVVHKGHTAQAKHVLKPYLPGQETSAYVNGGAFFALGLIYANHGSGIIDYLMEQLRAAAGGQQAEVKEHGCCLGLGLAAMGTANKEVFDMLNNKLGFNNAVVGEAAAIGMGLVMLGSGDAEAFANMCEYAAETQHEKIIRGIAVGSALLFYGQQGQAASPIEKLCSDEDPIMRMAGCHTIATAFAGVNDNAMIKKLLHIAVSDVNDDVRRSAVTALGFVLCRNSEQLPSTVMLLSESFNPHVRYGTCMALGIACAGTGSPEAIGLLEPLVQDPVGYVRQSAFIALALIMMQQPNDHPKSKWIREELAKAVGDKHQDILSKFGAIYAQGVLEAGGRNVTARLVNAEGHLRMQAVVGMLLFTQFWFWFPLGHCLALALTPTAVICVNEKLQMPTNIKLKSNASPSKFDYPPMIKIKEEKSKEKVEKAVLSTTAKAKAKVAKKEKESGTEAAPMEVDSKPEDGKKGDDADIEATAKPDEPEANFCMLANPARVVAAQIAGVTFEEDGRYHPVISGPIQSGIIVVTNERPDEPEDVIKIEAPTEDAPAEEADMPAPFEFKLAEEGEDDGK
jgi:26S proteasome regulatory subunit N2